MHQPCTTSRIKRSQSERRCALVSSCLFVCVCVSLSLSLYLSIYLSLFSQALKSIKQVTTLRGWFSLPRHSWPCCHANPRTRLMLCFLKLLFGMTEKQCQHPRMNSQELGAIWSNASRNRRNSHSLVLSFSLKDSNAVTRLHCGVILTEKRTTGKAYKRIHTQISVDRIYIYIYVVPGLLVISV